MSEDASDAQRRIYDTQAELYDELVSAEDADGNLVRELGARASLYGARVVDVGAGTGRVSRLVAKSARSLTLVDRAPAMLEVAERRLAAMGASFEVRVADARTLPLPDASADVAIAGWVFGHFRHWMPDGWREEVRQAVAEMRRVVRRGGDVVVIETLGTGHEVPRAHAALDEYFEELERLGFVRTWIRTDYVFASVADATRICGAFFGSALVEAIERAGSARVPECTAVFAARV